MSKIDSVAELKRLTLDGVHDFFILLHFGIRSSKTIDYNPEKEKFEVVNESDYTEQELTEEELFDADKTHIGEAMKKGSFYSYL